MNINWKVRFRNKVWLTGFLSAVVTFAYTLLRLFDLTPAIAEDTLMQALAALLTLLTGLGVVVDPTTAGASDSARAMTYTTPAK